MTDRLLDEPRLLVNRNNATGSHTMTLAYANPLNEIKPPRSLK